VQRGAAMVVGGSGLGIIYSCGPSGGTGSGAGEQTELWAICLCCFHEAGSVPHGQIGLPQGRLGRNAGMPAEPLVTCLKIFQHDCRSVPQVCQLKGLAAGEGFQSDGSITMVDIAFAVSSVEGKSFSAFKRVEGVFLPLCSAIDGREGQAIFAKPPIASVGV